MATKETLEVSQPDAISPSHLQTNFETRQTRPQPPPLPPRMGVDGTVEPPPIYSLLDEGDLRVEEQWHSQDPRSSSTQSLVPVEADRHGRRTLLLIYIHGFMGNETSFQSFPAHAHNLLSITLSETHTVHTKIYPRYKSRKAIEFARDDFSKWLEPHENTSTDVVLLGHSLGGILASEVVLMPPSSTARSEALKHRILGTISFDTPFLGMHPGVIVSGIGSLFRPSPEPPATSSSANSPGGEMATPSLGRQDSSSSSLTHSYSENGPQSPLSSVPSNDPNYNPPFPNDVRIAERKGWGNLFHFVNKHGEGLAAATQQYFMSHLEFGGCLADFSGLKSRYTRIRRLEDVDELASRQEQRVRFINYYTASTGRPKIPKVAEVKVPDEQNLNLQVPLEGSMNEISLDPEHERSESISTLTAEGGDGNLVEDDSPTLSSGDNEVQAVPMQHIDSIPMDEEDEASVQVENAVAETDMASSPGVQEVTSSVTLPSISEAQLPPLPPIPAEPTLVDISVYTDKDARKVVEKEQKRVLKAYQQALKDRESAVKDRQKVLEKRQKKARQEQEKQDKMAQKQREKEEREEQRRLEKVEKEEQRRLEKEKNQAKPDPVPSVEVKAEKPKRDKKFCLLPSDLSGEQDVCWIRVYMEGVDEVGAHCGLFSVGQHYEGLVGEVGSRVEEWVREDATRRAILKIEGN